jgi:pyridoxamine 5'-phosphate oxidase
VTALRRSDLDPDPLRQLERWRYDAAEAGLDTTVAALATASAGGRPSVRMVLVKGLEDGVLRFFTNYESRKAAELAENPRAALLFHWPVLGRQVRVEGPVSRVAREESEAYAHSRPRQSQLSALASPQSRPVPDREWLERRVEELAREHAGAELPVREDWGGYRVEPEAWEFWQHRDNRLHDRQRYERTAGGWHAQRLAP